MRPETLSMSRTKAKYLTSAAVLRGWQFQAGAV